MKIAVICFTAQGAKTSLAIKRFLEQRCECVEVWCRKKEFQPPEGIRSWMGNLKEWTKKAFADSDAVIFCRGNRNRGAQHCPLSKRENAGSGSSGGG